MDVAVIGVGSMGQNHARVLFNIDSVRLVAVADPDARQAEKVAKKYNARWYTSYQAMLDSEKLDAVTVAVPTKYHKDCALAVMEKKIPLLLEKPIASTIAEAQEIIDYSHDKIDFLNLNELEVADNSHSNLKQFGFHVKNNLSYAIKGSLELGLRLIEYSKIKGYKIASCF